MDIKINDNIENFIFAGNSTFTLESSKTFKRYTYKVSQSKTNKKMYFVKLLIGNNNELDYTYIGMIINNKFYLTKASKLNFKSQPVIVFNFFLHKLKKLNTIGLNVYHENLCARCGRKLTTPESIISGFGPLCRTLI